MKIKSGISITLALALFGCGGDGESAKTGTVEPAKAQSAVSQASQLKDAAESDNAGQTLGAAFALNGAAQSFVTPADPTTQAVTQALDVITGAQTNESSCSGGSCTFNKVNHGGVTIDGTVKTTDAGDGAKKIDIDLTITVFSIGDNIPIEVQQMSNVKIPSISAFIAMKGSLTVSSTLINGEFSSNFDVKIEGDAKLPDNFSAGNKSLIRFESVTLSGGQATGGSIYAKVTYAADVGTYEATHTFGSGS